MTHHTIRCHSYEDRFPPHVIKVSSPCHVREIFLATVASGLFIRNPNPYLDFTTRFCTLGRKTYHTVNLHTIKKKKNISDPYFTMSNRLFFPIRNADDVLGQKVQSGSYLITTHI